MKGDDKMDKLKEILKKKKKRNKEIERQVKRFKRYHFSEEMIKDLNNYFQEHHGTVEFYIDSPWGRGVKGTDLYQIFKKYGKEKILTRRFRKIEFPIIWNIQEGTFRINLGT